MVPQVVTLDPLSDDETASFVVPFHNAALNELFPDRKDAGADEFKVRFAAPEMETRFFGVIGADGALAGLCVVRLWIDGTNEHLLFMQILVRPDRRRDGLGRLLLGRAVEVAESTGRSMVMADTFDTVRAGAGFAAAVGAEVGIREHVSRVAVAQLNMARLQTWLGDGPNRAVDYDLIRWTDGYPDTSLGGVAELFVMADEDMPFEDAAFEPITETAESLRMRLDASKPVVQRVTSVAVLRSSGQLVGFSELIRRLSDTSTLFTALTTVHRDHRGHGLGKWLKADVITAAIARFPDTQYLQTENAFSNAAMLGINDAIGFVPQYTLTSYQLATAKVRQYLES